MFICVCEVLDGCAISMCVVRGLVLHVMCICIVLGVYVLAMFRFFELMFAFCVEVCVVCDLCVCVLYVVFVIAGMLFACDV